MKSIEERLKRVEKKLFPENIRSKYTYKSVCKNEECYGYHMPLIIVSNTISLNKCKYCGSDMDVSDIYEEEIVVWEED